VRRTSRSLKRASSPDRRLGIVSCSITRSIRGTQIPIVRDEPPSSRFPRFPPLEVFRRRPPVRAAPSVSGWHPKTFTKADLRHHLHKDSRPHSRNVCFVAPPAGGGGTRHSRNGGY